MPVSPPEIKDIRGLWVIPDYSLYFLIALLLSITVVIIATILYLKRLRKEKLEHKLRVDINDFLYIQEEGLKEFSYKSTNILQHIYDSFDIAPTKNPFIKKHSQDTITSMQTKIREFIQLCEKYKYKPDINGKINEEIKQQYDNLSRQLNDYL